MNATDQHEADYLQVLGLSRPPFTRETSEGVFYEEPGCKHCLDLLLHLGRFGELVLLVSGVLGSGKSTLFDQFLARSDSGVFTCSIDAATAVDKQQLEDLLLAELGINDVSDRKQGINKVLKNRLQAINRKYSAVILLIDNVDQLPATLYSFLQEITAITDDDGSMLLHLVFFAEPQVELKLKGLFADKLKILKLSPYSLEETSKYLKYRLLSADSSSGQFSEIFDSVSILNIYKLSNGVPGRINKLAHHKLLEMADKKSPPLAMRKLNRSSKWQWLTCILLIGIITSAWFFPNEIRQYVIYIQQEYKSALVALQLEFPSLAELSLAEKVSTKETPAKETVSSVSVFEEDRSSTISQDSGTLTTDSELVFGITSESAPEIISETVFEIVSDITEETEEETAEIVEAETRKTDIEDQVLLFTGADTEADTGADNSNKQTAIDDVGDVSAENIPFELRREKWLLSQEGQKYTLQLFGSKDEADISRVVNRYKLNGRLAYFRTQKKGGQWFGLTYGVYSDLHEARGAASQLPRRLKNDVWVRKLRSIHQEIEKNDR